MALDLHINVSGEIFHFDISESLHSSIFSNKTRWSSLKYLRKIKDYYRADSIFKENDAILFINELIHICEVNSLEGIDIKEIKNLINNGEMKYIRVSSD
ncbi:hypothetical protein [Kosakonia sp.]|uniref:hypothetical protein n=1 Tax=Kosakonia sp. TaxID=1916651 RepID=UPI0028A13B70|nr:hypothetical protein [Kosakonia sp.]